jgi:hypothetical protein
MGSGYVEHTGSTQAISSHKHGNHLNEDVSEIGLTLKSRFLASIERYDRVHYNMALYNLVGLRR